MPSVNDWYLVFLTFNFSSEISPSEVWNTYPTAGLLRADMADNTRSNRKRTATPKADELPLRRSTRRSVAGEVSAKPTSRVTPGATEDDTKQMGKRSTATLVSSPDTPKTNPQRGARRSAKPTVPAQRAATLKPAKIAKGATGRKSTTQNSFDAVGATPGAKAEDTKQMGRRSTAALVSTLDTPKTNPQRGARRSAKPAVPAQRAATPKPATLSTGATRRASTTQNRQSNAPRKSVRGASHRRRSPSESESESSTDSFSDSLDDSVSCSCSDCEFEDMVRENRKPAPKKQPKVVKKYCEIYAPD